MKVEGAQADLFAACLLGAGATCWPGPEVAPERAAPRAAEPSPELKCDCRSGCALELLMKIYGEIGRL